MHRSSRVRLSLQEMPFSCIGFSFLFLVQVIILGVEIIFKTFPSYFLGLRFLFLFAEIAPTLLFWFPHVAPIVLEETYLWDLPQGFCHLVVEVSRLNAVDFIGFYWV